MVWRGYSQGGEELSFVTAGEDEDTERTLVTPLTRLLAVPTRGGGADSLSPQPRTP